MTGKCYNWDQYCHFGQSICMTSLFLRRMSYATVWISLSLSLILLPPSPSSWAYKHVPANLGVKPRVLWMLDTHSAHWAAPLTLNAYKHLLATVCLGALEEFLQKLKLSRIRFHETGWAAQTLQGIQGCKWVKANVRSSDRWEKRRRDGSRAEGWQNGM